MSYELKLFFDAGSGVCLWSQNDKARERYGYPIDHWELPLSENTKRWLQYLIAWYDTSLDWSNPGDPDYLWDEKEALGFKKAVEKAIQMLTEELPEPHYFIMNGT